jgi:hypothetical protein
VKPLTGYRVLILGGVVLIVVMSILLRVGTTSEGTFYLWIVLLLVGAGAAWLGGKLDSNERAKAVRADLERRRSTPPGPSGP